MRKASSIMYKIGRIINIVLLVLSIVLIVLGIVTMVSGNTEIAEDPDFAAFAAFGTASMLVFGIVLLIPNIIVLFFAKRAIMALESGSHAKFPHIIMIVLGAISQDYFFLLGGIFGLFA